MWQGFTIALREGIEAFLIVALTLSYLARTGRHRDECGGQPDTENTTDHSDLLRSERCIAARRVASARCQ